MELEQEEKTDRFEKIFSYIPAVDFSINEGSISVTLTRPLACSYF